MTAPVLQPPGAGLPWVERLVARYIVVPLQFRKLDWATADRLFQDEGAKILALWDAFPPERRTERVLIRRLQGLEDSSRFWSAAMTVEHLNIVGFSLRQLIAALRSGTPPARGARIEDVKPTGEVPPEQVRDDFARLLAEAKSAEATEAPVPRGTGPTSPHPWFGPFGAYEWHAMLAFHQRLHRVQLEAIRAGLR